MKQYDSYKDSGVEWIGKVPSHWGTIRNKFFCSYIKGKNPEVFSFEQSKGMLPYLSMEYLRGKELNIRYSYPQDNHVICYEDDILLLWDGSNAGEFILSKHGIMSSTCALLHISGLQHDYYKYLSKCFETRLKDMTNGMGIPHVDSNIFKNIFLPIPSKKEQEAIASFLDAETARIDNIIKAREEKIKLLEELRASIISKAVTKGIRKDVEYKDSGIEWIGRIPKHWEICPLKRCLTLRNGQDYKHVEVEKGYPVYGSGGIFKQSSQYLYDGEAVLFGRKGTIDRPLYVVGKFWTVDTMFYSIPSKYINCKYMYFQGLTIPFDRYSTSTAVPSMTQSDLGRHIVCRPPLDEQNEIVKFIDSKIETITGSIKKACQEIKLLKEYRSSLITEVVTGKRKVVA